MHGSDAVTRITGETMKRKTPRKHTRDGRQEANEV